MVSRDIYLSSSRGTATPGSKTVWHTGLRLLTSPVPACSPVFSLTVLWDIDNLHESTGRRGIKKGVGFEGNWGKSRSYPEETPVTEVRRKGWVMGCGRVWETGANFSAVELEGAGPGPPREETLIGGSQHVPRHMGMLLAWKSALVLGC